MTDQSIPALRALSIGELLDQSFRIYRRNFMPFLGMVAIAQAPLLLLQLFAGIAPIFAAENLRPARGETIGFLLGMLGFFAGFIIIAILTGISQMLANSAVVRAIIAHYSGKQIGILDAYRQVFPRAGKLFGSFLLLVVLYMVGGSIAIIPCVGWIVAFAPFAFCSMVGQFLTPVLMTENFSAWDSIRRAWFLLRRRFWWAVGVILALTILVTLASIGPTLAFVGILGIFFPSRTGGDFTTFMVIQGVVQALMTVFLTTIFQPLQIITMMVAYFDLRVRTEGMDLLVNAAREQGQVPDEQLFATTASLADEPFFTQEDIINLIALSLAGIALYIVMYAFFFMLGLFSASMIR